MAISPAAPIFADTLDPHEEPDFKVEFGDMLEAGEAIDDADWILEVLPEAAALGLTVMSGNGRDAALSNGDTAVIFWLSIDPAYRGNAAFDGAGIELPLRITTQTSSSPSRKRQRTFQVRVAQR